MVVKKRKITTLLHIDLSSNFKSTDQTTTRPTFGLFRLLVMLFDWESGLASLPNW